MLACVDARLLRSKLRIEIGDVGLGLRDLRLCLIELSLEVAIVEPHQHGAGLDELIVRHRNVDDGGADLRADLHRSGVDKRVIGGFVMAGVDPPDHETDQRDDE